MNETNTIEHSAERTESPGPSRLRTIELDLDEEELLRLCEHAIRVGVPLSTYIRRQLRSADSAVTDVGGGQMRPDLSTAIGPVLPTSSGVSRSFPRPGPPIRDAPR